MSLTVPCPNCSKKLKLPGPEVFGKAVKCPACGNRFVIKAEGKAKKASPAKKRTAATPPKETLQEEQVPVAAPVGLEARYVFDEPAAPSTTPEFAPSMEDAPSFDFTAPDDTPAFVPPAVSSHGESEADSSSSPVDPIASFKEKRAKKKKQMTIIGVSSAALLAVVGSAVVMMLPKSTPKPVVTTTTTTNTQPTVKTSLQIESPTRGEAIPTNLLPAGVGLVVHLHPAEIWNGPQAAGLIGAMPPSFKPWAEDAIRRYALREPSEIAELTIGIIFGARGVEPKTTAVVRTVEPKPLGDMLQEFPGEIKRFGEARLVETADKAIFIKDESTFAVAPPDLGNELSESQSGPSDYLAAGIDQIVDQTDRDRLFSVVVGVDDFDVHASSLVPEGVIDLANSIIGTLDVPQAFVWSIHPGENLYSEFTVHPRAGTNPIATEQKLLATMSKLPTGIVSQLKLRNPRQQGVRDIVGRYPAMLEAARLSTDVVADSRHGVVDIRTLLPSVAGPNLALGSVLTYNVLAVKPEVIVAAGPKEPVETDNRSVAEKLETVVAGEFQRTPLQEALAYLAEEGKFNLEIDGDALKFAGYTKNMAQTFDMGDVTIKEALRQITVQYDKMAVAIDEASGTLIVLTFQFAEQRGLKPIEF